MFQDCESSLVLGLASSIVFQELGGNVVVPFSRVYAASATGQLATSLR
jgi:hypothetical protein